MDYVVVIPVTTNTSGTSQKEFLGINVERFIYLIPDRVITSGLNDGRSKSSVVNMSP